MNEISVAGSSKHVKLSGDHCHFRNLLKKKLPTKNTMKRLERHKEKQEDGGEAKGIGVNWVNIAEDQQASEVWKIPTTIYSPRSHLFGRG